MMMVDKVEEGRCFGMDACLMSEKFSTNSLISRHSEILALGFFFVHGCFSFAPNILWCVLATPSGQLFSLNFHHEGILGLHMEQTCMLDSIKFVSNFGEMLSASIQWHRGQVLEGGHPHPASARSPFLL
jgi:hypothetical protein